MKKHSLIIDIILTFLTIGLWNIWVQYRQMRDINYKLGEKRYSFLIWLILTVISFGFYHIYHEYKLTRDILRADSEAHDAEMIGLVVAIVSFLGFWVIVDLYQQNLLNESIS